MKLSLGICLIAIICGTKAQIYPGKLFEDAFNQQKEINEKQTEIFQTIMDLRTSLSNVLKNTSNNALHDIESDVKRVFDIDAPYRTLFFETHTDSTDCMMNLRNRLNFETEFTGFMSGICLATYDKGVSLAIEEAYKTVGIYDDELSKFELSVIEAFAGKNVWTQPDDIRVRFVDSFQRFNTVLAELKDRIDGLSLNIENEINAFRRVLNDCYLENQTYLSSTMKRLEIQLNTCIIFDAKP